MGAQTGPRNLVGPQISGTSDHDEVTTSRNGSKSGVDTVSMRETTQVDDTGTFVYIGYAKRGTATNAASWFIERYTKATGVRLLASEVYNQIWDNRTSLSYS